MTGATRATAAPGRWDLRLVPSAATAWVVAILVLQSRPVAAALLAAGVGAAWGTWIRARTRARWPDVNRAVTVVLLCAAAAGLAAWAATQPARALLSTHPPGATVRVTATVTEEPRSYTHTSFSGEGEAGTGTAITLHLHTADAARADTDLTVFTTRPEWSRLSTHDTLTAILTLTDTATPARPTARATSPPRLDCSRACGSREPSALQGARQALARVSLSHGASAAGLVPGMTVGDTSQLPESLNHDMRTTGLTHLTAVSGSNCALVMTLTGYAVLSLGASRRVCVLTGLGALAAFVVLVGPDPSVLRASVMGSLGALAMLSGRNGVSLNALCAAVIGLVLVSPPLATDFGFVLSVLATTGIVVSAPSVTRLIALGLPEPVAACIAVPLVAQLWCGPVVLLLNPALPTYSLPANIAAAPLVPLVTVAGLIAVCLLAAPHLLTPPLTLLPGGLDATRLTSAWERAAQLPVTVAAQPARGVAWTAEFFADLPGAQIPWPKGPWGIALLCALSLLLLGALHWADARRHHPPATAGTLSTHPAPPPKPETHWIRTAGQRRRLRRALAVLALAATTLLTVQAALWWHRPAPPWDSVVCDVGQGDAVLHRTGDHRAVLIDTGPDPRALTRCLQQAQINHLDALILTHDHNDHTGGTPALIDRVPVDRLWYSTATGDLPHAAQPLADRAHRPAPGETLTLGAVHLTVLGPSPLTNGPPTSGPTPRRQPTSHDENNASLALRITITHERDNTPSQLGDQTHRRDHDDTTHRTTTWFTAGDLEEEGAATLTRSHTGALHADILKVSHHGARNGGPRIITAVDPALAVISVGADNTYGHPNPGIVSALQDSGAAVARTDQSGALWIRRDGTRLAVARR